MLTEPIIFNSWRVHPGDEEWFFIGITIEAAEKLFGIDTSDDRFDKACAIIESAAARLKKL